MGVSYSQPNMKAKLTMASQRLLMMINKHNNRLKMDEKDIANLLSAKKEEAARMKTEVNIVHKNNILVMEIVQLMCDLLRQRLSVLTISKECPADLEESIATVIYCSKCIDCPELSEIGRMCGGKFGEEWARPHLNNEAGKVNGKVIKLTGANALPFKVVSDEMKNIANKFHVEWTSSLEDRAHAKNSAKEHREFGLLLPVNKKVDALAEVPFAASKHLQPAVASPAFSAVASPHATAAAAFSLVGSECSVARSATSSDASSGAPQPFLTPNVCGITRYPGTANIVICEAKELQCHVQPQRRADVYFRVVSQTSKMFSSWKSSAFHFSASGILPKWPNEHFPIPVHDETDQLLLELHELHADGDELIGYQVVPIEDITTLAQPKWIRLQQDHSDAFAGAVLLKAQYLPLNAPNPGAGCQSGDSIPLLAEYVSDLNSSEISASELSASSSAAAAYSFSASAPAVRWRHLFRQRLVRLYRDAQMKKLLIDNHY